MRTHEDLLREIALARITPCPSGQNCTEHHQRAGNAPGRLTNPYHPNKTGHKTFTTYLACVALGAEAAWDSLRRGWDKSVMEVDLLNNGVMPDDVRRLMAEKFGFHLCQQWFEMVNIARDLMPELIMFYFENVGNRIKLDLDSARRIIERGQRREKGCQASRYSLGSESSWKQMTLPMPNDTPGTSSSTP